LFDIISNKATEINSDNLSAPQAAALQRPAEITQIFISKQRNG
jgi:hypothetical protein